MLHSSLRFDASLISLFFFPSRFLFLLLFACFLLSNQSFAETEHVCNVQRIAPGLAL